MGGYVASALKAAGHEVALIDCTVNGWDFPGTANAVLASSPALLAVNCVYIWENTGAIFAFFQNLRRAGFGGHINLFGFYPTLAYRCILGFCAGSGHHCRGRVRNHGQGTGGLP